MYTKTSNLINAKLLLQKNENTKVSLKWKTVSNYSDNLKTYRSFRSTMQIISDISYSRHATNAITWWHLFVALQNWSLEQHQRERRYEIRLKIGCFNWSYWSVLITFFKRRSSIFDHWRLFSRIHSENLSSNFFYSGV